MPRLDYIIYDKFVQDTCKITHSPPPPTNIVNTPDVIQSFVAYIGKLKYDEKPDYEKCRKDFEKAVKATGKPNSGDLEFKAAISSTSKKVPSRANAKESKRPSSKYVIVDSEDDMENISPKPKSTRKRISRSTDRNEDVSSPVKKVRSSSAKTLTQSRKPSTASSSNKHSTEQSATDSSIIVKNHINDTKTKKTKTYNLNFELDISFDANVIVNVTRKAKNKSAKKESTVVNESVNSVGEIPASEKSVIVQSTKVIRKATRSSPRSK